ncbi:MAG: helix-turn-helix domain-containing protein [Thiobacillus sp.]|nr:helix-turn-helix domain-containing protein [Thiobacillus sp.]
MVSDNYHEALVQLGARLRAQRLMRNEPQARFAARLGVSVPTLRRLEQGDASAQIGHWLAALELLGRLHEAEAWLAPQTSLFAAAEPAPPQRQRARRRKVAT